MNSNFRNLLSLNLILICIILLSSTSFGASMVSSNILTRVFNLRYGENQATGFTIEVDGRQYVITARHLLPSAPSEGVIEIFHNSAWAKISFHSIQVEPTIDIAVLALPQQISSLLPIELGFKDTYLSQAVFFVGFPFGLSIDGKSLNNGFPIPLVKHGIISSFGGLNEPFLVDGINNPGFSGGPVVRVDNNNSNPAIIGVVSAYKAVQEAVFQGQSKTDLSIQANTGLLVAYPIDHAIEAIKKNPIGFIVKPSS